MKNGMLAIGVVALTAMGTTNAFAQKKPAKCTNVPLTVEILAIGPDNTGALDGDAKGRIYTDGVDGVDTVINLCSGSNDATVGLGRRSMVMRFPDHADGPIWVGNDILTKPFLNVRDLLWGRRNGSASTFTTWMSFGFIKGPGDNSDYVLRFKADVTDAPIPRQTASEPGTVEVTVQEDTPVACATGSKHSWTVTTLPGPSIGALYRTSTDAPAGRYDMPFRLRFATKGCVTLPW